MAGFLIMDQGRFSRKVATEVVFFFLLRQAVGRTVLPKESFLLYLSP